MNYSTKKLIHLLAVAAFAVVVVCAASIRADDASENATELTNILTKLFKTETYLEPDQTLALLKRLKDEFYNDLDEDEQQTVVALLKLSEPDDSNCRLHTFEQIDGLQENNFEFKRSIVPYIEHFKVQQLEVCKPKMVEDLQKFVNSLDSKYADALENLMSPLGREDEPMNGLIHGLVDLVRRNGRVSRKAKEDKEEFLVVFREVASNFCAKLEEPTMAEQKRIYDIVFYDKDEIVAVNKFIKNMKDSSTYLPLPWISYARICHDITSHLYHYSEEVREKIKKEDTLSGKAKKFLRRLTNKN